MDLVSFAGRSTFAALFLFSAYLEIIQFGTDGGPAAKLIAPKYGVFRSHVSLCLGVEVPEVDMKHVVTATIALKVFGGLLFILNSSFGACLLFVYLLLSTPIMFDFYNYDTDKPEFAELFAKFTQNLAMVGALLFFVGMKNSINRRQTKRKNPKAKTKTV